MHEGMTSSLDLQKLSTEHERIAHTSSEYGIARLASPGVEGLQICFASVVDGNPIGVQEVREGYEANMMHCANTLVSYLMTILKISGTAPWI